MKDAPTEGSASEALRQSPLGEGLSPSELTELGMRLPLLEVDAGEVLMEAGAAADAAYVLLSGQLEVRAPDGAFLTRHDPGVLVGEIALLAEGPRTRTATIRAGEASRLLRVDADVFAELLAEHEQRRQRVEAGSDARTLRSLRTLSGSLGHLFASSQRRTWFEGEVVFEEGDPADGLHMVLAGRAEVVAIRDGEPVHFSTVYPGRIFGELGTLQDEPRTASIVARSGLRTAFVPAAQVQSLGEQHPELRTFLETLLRSYELPKRGRLHQRTVFREGQACVQTDFILDDGRQLTAVRDSEGQYTLTQTGATVARSLKVAEGTVISLDAERRIVGIEDAGTYDEISELQALALDGAPLSTPQRRALRKAAREAALLDPEALICNCLGLKRAVLQAAIDEGARTAAALQEATGCGTVCGGCMKKTIPAMLEKATPTAEPALPAPVPSRLPRMPRLVPWLGNFTFSRDPAGFQRRGHQRHGPVFGAQLLGQELVFIDPSAQPDLVAQVCAAPADALDAQGAWRVLVGKLLGEAVLEASPDLDRPLESEALGEVLPDIETGPVDLVALAGRAAVTVLMAESNPSECSADPAELARLLTLMLADLSAVEMLLPVDTPAMKRRMEARRRLEALVGPEQLALLLAVVPNAQLAVVATLLELLEDPELLAKAKAELDTPEGLHHTIATCSRRHFGGAIWRLARRPVELGGVVAPEGALVGVVLDLTQGGGRADGQASVFDEAFGTRAPGRGLPETISSTVLAALLRERDWRLVDATGRWVPRFLPGMCKPFGAVLVGGM